MCRYVLGGVPGGILKNSAVALSFGIGLRGGGGGVPGVMAAIIPIPWNVPVPSIVATL